MNQHLVALFSAVAATASLLAACGGGAGTDTSSFSPPPAPPPGAARGTLVGTANVSSMSRAAIDAYNADGSKGPTNPDETASCDVSLRQIQYATIDPQGVALTASAGLLVPVGGAACTQGRPLLSFQHGTSDSNGFDGSNRYGELPQTLAMYFAAHGYVVVIPDYLGYGVSITHYHPYVVAEAEADTVIDAVRGARHWFATADGVASGVTLSGQLFLSGTSEGGYVTMATHRAMERDFASEFEITADVPVSGPYDLATEVMNDLLYADATHNQEAGATAFLLAGMQDSYGDIWSTPSQVFQPPWDTTAPGLFPSGLYASDNDAIDACQLPFDITTSPGPAQGDCPRNALLQPQFVTDYESGAVGTPGGTARAHVEANGLLQGWAHGGVNAAPMIPCYGDLDPVAALNAKTAAGFFGTAAVDVQVEGPGFITLWMNYVSQNPGDLQYHGGIEAPGCTAYARYAVFDQYVSAVP